MTPRLSRAEFCAQFGDRLRDARALKGYSQVALGNRAGYTAQMISGFERGVYLPSLMVVFVLAEALEIHPKELLFGAEE